MIDKISFNVFTKTTLISLPEYFRNDNWALQFGEIQQHLSKEIRIDSMVVVDISKCLWIDPLPMLSLIITLNQVPEGIKKQVHLKNKNNKRTDQYRLMSFLETEGFLTELANCGCELLIKSSNDDFYPLSEMDREEYRNYETFLSFSEPTILQAKVVDLSLKIQDDSLDEWVDQLLNDAYKFTHKFQELSKHDISTRVNLFLKETLDNIYEHAYPEPGQKKLAGIYIRFRKGLADNSLDMSARAQLKKIIDREGAHCPRLEKNFLEDISSFIEIFIIDAGVGIVESYFKDTDRPKYPFREAWRNTIGFGKRGINNIKKKFTKYGGLYALSRLLHQNYLTARDHNEWIGGILPIKPSHSDLATNRSYELISENKVQITGLALIGRISWLAAADENVDWGTISNTKPATSNTTKSNPFLSVLIEQKDIYTKYENKPFNSLQKNLHFVRDDKYNYNDNSLSSKYLNIKDNVAFCLYMPKAGNAKNVIHSIVESEFLDITENSRTLIIGDICVWETNLYQLALQDATYSEQFLEKYDRILLISKRLSVLYLENDGKTFKHNNSKQSTFIWSDSANFDPSENLKHYFEWIRTHDSMVFWQHLNQSNKLTDYYINSNITWFQGDKSIILEGYLNFSKTLTDRFCISIYENALERSLCLDSQSGCKYESIDVLTNKICQKFNSLFYNRILDNPETIFVGSVIVTGYTARSLQSATGNTKANTIHFFYNLNINGQTSFPPEMHLLLWPLRGKEWFVDNVNNIPAKIDKGKYMRVGATHVIAPSGWKYFTVPRYKLFDKNRKVFVDGYTSEQANDSENYTFVSIYKCNPRDSYQYWQGRKTEAISVAHTVYEGNHDMFKIDFPYILNESFTLGDGLAIFLLGEFILNLGIDPDAIITDNPILKTGVIRYVQEEVESAQRKLERTSIIVYPYHYNTEYAIELIKNHLPEDFHSQIIAIFPVNKDRYGSSFIPSPITIEMISQSVGKEIQRLENLGEKAEIKALLFDDATIGGKTRSDINHILYSQNVKSVNTLSIVERSRLPFSTSYPFKHKAYWRLDIPKLGNEDSCPICRAFKDIDNFSNMLVSKNALERVARWKYAWMKRAPFEFRGGKALTPVVLGLGTIERFKSFGIYFDGVDHQQCGGEHNKIELSTSIGLSIYTAELYSNTTRDDFILQYVHNVDLADSAKLEMLCTNMLLFGREFSTLVKNRVISSIFLLAERSEENNLTALAAITLLSLGRDSLEVLHADAKDTMERDVIIQNLDMQIVLSRQSSFRHSKFYGSKKLMRLHSGFQSLRMSYKQFHSELYNDFGLAHDTPLQLVVKEMSSNLKTIMRIQDSFDKVKFLLDSIPVWQLRTVSGQTPEADTLLKQNIFMQLDESKVFLLDKSNNVFEEQTARKFQKMGKEWIGNLKKYHDRLFLCVDGNGAVNMAEVLRDLISENQFDLGVSPAIQQPQTAELDFSHWICWDKEVLTSLTALLGNSRHSQPMILDHYGPKKFEPKRGWLTVEFGEDHLKLKMANHSLLNASEITMKTMKRNKPEKLHLKELNISVSYQDILGSETELVETIINFPYLNTYE